MLILFYILDSLRRDALGCYGGIGLTPHLDRLAAEATRFTDAYAAAPWSKASGAAILTGELPRAIHMRGLLDRLPATVPTLAERLQAAGWQTIALSANPFIADDFGLLRGMARRIEAFRPGTLPGEQFHFHANHFRRLADSLSVEPEALVLARSEALHAALLDELPADQPTFALCWSMDPHAPFFVRGERSHFGNPLDRLIPAADPEWLTGGLTVADMVALYRDMVAYADEQFGALVAALRARGLWEEALIVVAADHGEAFGEHGVMGHTNGLWEEQIAVPLLVKFPGQRAAATCTTPVLLTDLAPTVAEWLALPPPATGEGAGIALPRVLAGEAAARGLLLESPDGWGLRVAEWKLVAPTDAAPARLFNLSTDPTERRPLGDASLRASLTSHAAALRAAADQRAQQWPPPPPADDDAILDRLRGLGYL